MYAEGERVYCTRSSVPGKGGVAQESRALQGLPYSSFLVYFICFISFFQPYLPNGSPYLTKIGLQRKAPGTTNTSADARRHHSQIQQEGQKTFTTKKA